MKIKTHKSVFSDLADFIEIIEPLTIDDYKTSTRPLPKPTDEQIINNNNNYYRRVGVIFEIEPKPELKELLESVGLVAHSKATSRGKDIKFNGIKTDERKLEKFNEEYQNFPLTVDNQKAFNYLVGKLNEQLERQVQAINEEYSDEHKRLFIDRGSYMEEVWSVEFAKVPQLVKLNEEITNAQKAYDEARAKLRKLKGLRHDVENNHILDSGEVDKLAPNVRDLIKSKLKTEHTQDEVEFILEELE